MAPSSNDSTGDIWIPEGFVTAIGPNDEKYIVPDYMFPALQQQWIASQKKLDLDADTAPGTVSLFFNYFVCLSCNVLRVPGMYHSAYPACAGRLALYCRYRLMYRSFYADHHLEGP